MSPRTKKQYKEIRKEKRAIIIEAALEVFAEKTFMGASVSMITQKAEVSKGLLYNYFESKEDLLRKIILEGFDEFVQLFDPNKDGVLTENEFDYFIEETFRLLKKDTRFWKLYFSIIVQPAVMELVQDKLMEIIGPFLQTLIKYYEKKGIANPTAHAILMGAVMDGVSMNYLVDPENFPVEDIKKIIIDKFK
ncbi:MAG: TetR/AcrR family transcriptional regulator [Bacteroidota bacterium]